MANRNRPSALHTDTFDLLSTGNEIILQARGSQQRFVVRDENGNPLSLAAENAGSVTLEEDGAQLIASAVALNFTGSGVDVVNDGDNTATLTVTDTHADIHEDGALLLENPTALEFIGTGVDVVDNGDNTATATITDTNTSSPDTNTQAWPLAQTAIPGADAATWRWHVEDGQTWELIECGLQDPTQAVPAGAVLEVYNETAARAAHTSTAVYEEPLDVTVAGPADLRIQLQNTNAAGSGELLLAGQLDHGEFRYSAPQRILGSVALDAPRKTRVKNGYAYTTYGAGIAAVDCITLPEPAIASTLAAPFSADSARDLDVQGNHAYVAAMRDGQMVAVDISDPTALTTTSTVGVGTTPQAVQVAGNYAYVALDGGDGLAVVDITDPATAAVAGTVADATTMDRAMGVDVAGNYAYVVGFGSNSLAIVDVTDPAAPAVAGSVGGLNGPTDVAVEGNYAYVTAESGDTFHVVDVTDPAAPAVAASLTDANIDHPQDVDLAGNYAYIASLASNSITTVDISTPAAPTVAGAHSDDALLVYPRGVDVAQGYAFATGNASDTVVVLGVTE